MHVEVFKIDFSIGDGKRICPVIERKLAQVVQSRVIRQFVRQGEIRLISFGYLHIPVAGERLPREAERIRPDRLSSWRSSSVSRRYFCRRMRISKAWCPVHADDIEIEVNGRFFVSADRCAFGNECFLRTR